jgi:hypothetical protein
MHKISRLVPVVMLMSPMVMAKNFSLDLSAAVGESDNAFKTLHDETSEIQNRYSASVQGNWVADWAKLNLQYAGYQETFEDDSQEGENFLQGDSALSLGSASSLLNLDLRHSRRTLLKEVEDKPFADNQEEREILSAMPRLRWDLTSTDELIAYADISQTRYLETKLRDSDRTTYGVNLQHDFSPVDSLRLELKKMEADFIYFQQSDYSQQTATLIYEASLRNLSYSVGAGQQTIEPEFGEKTDDDHYQASVSYKMGEHSINLNYDRSVTDSSFGQGFDLGITDVPIVDSSSTQIGLIQRESSGVNFQSTAICIRCSLTVGYNESEDHYLATDTITTQRGINANFTYLFSSRLSLILIHGRSDQEPLAADNFSAEYKQDFSRVLLRYGVMSSLNLDVFYEREKRSSEIEAQNYVENFTGLALTYHFE